MTEVVVLGRVLCRAVQCALAALASYKELYPSAAASSDVASLEQFLQEHLQRRWVTGDGCGLGMGTGALTVWCALLGFWGRVGATAQWVAGLMAGAGVRWALEFR